MPITDYLRTSALVVTLGASCVACTTRYIPNTDVEDSEQNRNVIMFCEKYRKAVEHRDVPVLMAIASPKYYEDGGNIDPTDDMDFEGLRKYLNEDFQKAKAIRYEIRYRRVLVAKESDRIFVDYTYSASYKVPSIDEARDQWRRSVAENRLELVKEGESFKITGGM